MTFIDALASTPANPPPLDDNGMTSWPHESHYGRWPDEFLFVAEAWEKYFDGGEWRRIMEFRYSIECRACRAKLAAHSPVNAAAIAQEHQRTEHAVPLDQRGPHAPPHRRGQFEALSFGYVHSLWTYQALGFEQLWWGRPSGWYTILDGRNELNRQWEFDALELGTWVADAFARGPS